MAPKESCFDRLCDALLESIFERVLWNPCLLQHQALDRVRLEAVCKRFQELVRVTGCLEWDFNDWPRHQRQFIRYTLGNGRKGLLRKVALKAEQPFNLIAVLQSVLPHAKDTLQEVYLSLAFSEEDAKSIKWERVLAMLQECKQLVVLHIFLWESGWHRPAVILDCLKILPKPFAKLQDLSLFGFAVPHTEMVSFLKSFPTLKTLELHHLEGQGYDLSCSTKVVSWGSQTGGLDNKNTMVPKSLDLVVGLLDSESCELRQKALDMLADLLYDGRPEERIAVIVASVPGCLQKLVNLLNDQESAHWELALSIIEILAIQRGNCRPIAACSGSLQRLFELLGSDDETTRASAASTLRSLADDYRTKRRAVQLVPAILQAFVNLLDDDNMDVRSIAMESLARFADGFDSSELIALMPGALDKVVSFLACGKVELQEGAAMCLQTLARYDSARAVAKVPGCFEGLVNLLGSPSIAARGRAAWALSTLAEDSKPSREIPMVPGFWQKLVKCLDPREGNDPHWTRYMQEDVVTLLGHVGAEAGVLEAIASTPGSLQVVVDLLDDSDLSSTVESAVWMLREMARDQEFRKAINEVPGVFKKLEGILGYEDFKDVHEEALKLLDILR